MRNLAVVFLCFAAISFAGWRLGLLEKFGGKLASDSPAEADGRRSPAPPRTPVPDDPTFGVFRDRTTDDIEALHADIAKRIAGRNFEALDGIADEMRAKRLRLGNGAWKIREFYNGLSINESASDAAWQARLQLLQEWQIARPLSISARVALADALADYAWKARGSGYANTIAPEGGKLFDQRLAGAWTVLKEARALPTKDVFWWSVAQTVALGQGWAREDYEKLFREALDFEPQYVGFYTNKAKFLLPRWYGKEGDWERFAEESIKEPGGPGAEAYAQIVLSLDRYYEHIFRGSKARWDLTKAGLELMRERYPESTNLISDFAVMAARGNDPKSARKLFDELGDRIDRRYWKTKDRFLYHYRYAHPEAR